MYSSSEEFSELSESRGCVRIVLAVASFPRLKDGS